MHISMWKRLECVKLGLSSEEGVDFFFLVVPQVYITILP